MLCGSAAWQLKHFFVAVLSKQLALCPAVQEKQHYSAVLEQQHYSAVLEQQHYCTYVERERVAAASPILIRNKWTVEIGQAATPVTHWHCLLQYMVCMDKSLLFHQDFTPRIFCEKNVKVFSSHYKQTATQKILRDARDIWNIIFKDNI